ncbi:MAG: hypothetical protein KAG64_06735 [Bacteroidales bacterium]|nr:hypothetical protein [Bacteroidales bacterium]
MKKLATILIILSISLQSCFHYHAAFKQVEAVNVKPVVFSDSFEKALYKTNIQFLNKEYSGLMFFKRMNETHATRVVFMSEFGLKFFDFELLDNGEFSVKYILDELNRESLIGVLEQDIKLLFQTVQGPVERKYYFHENKAVYLEKYRLDKGRYYYFFDEKSTKISQIEFTGSVFKKIKIILGDYSNGLPKSIDIKHVNKALKLQLRLVK